MTFDSASPNVKASFNCCLCGKTAGAVEVLPPGHPNGLAKDSSTICITGFIGEERILLSGNTDQALRACLEQSHAAGLYQIEHLWAPFYCPACARVYCLEHWTVIPEFDGEFFDHSYGYCPEGHKRLIED
jgi:hypothetical protein